MNKKQKADVAESLVTKMGEMDQTCACDDCVVKRRAFNLELLPLLVALIAQDGR